MKYILPQVYASSFTCPNCGVLSRQEWYAANGHLTPVTPKHSLSDLVKSGICDHCNKFSFWLNEKMYYPENGSAPFPNPEMPESVKAIYLEAASISNKSPKGAAALLRLSIQILCKELGEKGENVNNDIKELVKKGLPTIVQQSLDIVRVTGNDAVHPGQIDTDNIEVVNRLFELINIIIEYMIALPKQVSGLYDSLPTDKISGIKKRDK